ncbi:xanthine dehydrogenase/oxidase [Grammomys surdaster]|uniref:xanthine dehydrogenase/oxidase n=1 Tax=Grammomys surdaster TaxID=491861 RepID=UPI00109F3C2C|nr:xanthine dehydrogenase/oxidase [Grammomys surdaster]
MTADELVFFVNGKKVVEKNADPETTLLVYLRRKLGLCGTKLGCGEGGCGACTVMISKYDRLQNKIIHFSVNACLAPICSLHHVAVTTVEGIGNTKKLHPVQERIARSHGSQCGFCTPGIVMSMYTLLRNQPEPTVEEIENAFQGNLCRCTGYRPILQGFRTFAKDGGCCGGSGNNPNCCMSQTKDKTIALSPSLFNPEDFKPLDPTQEPIFPPELLRLKDTPRKKLHFEGERVSWIQASTMGELLDLKAQHPDAKLVVGNTEIGIEMKFKNMLFPLIVCPAWIPELNSVAHGPEGISFGAACPLSLVESVLVDAIAKLPEQKTEVFRGVTEQLRWFAGKQVKSVASIGGNIITASPISDLNPVFMASGAKLTLVSRGTKRTVRMDHTFFPGYRRTLLSPEEILLSIEIPYSREGEFFSAFKQASRREDDIAKVTSGMRVLFKPGTIEVQELSLCFGGMANRTISALKTTPKQLSKSWNEELLQDVCAGLAEELHLAPDAPGGMVEFRRTLTLSFFFKFYLTVLQKLGGADHEGGSFIASPGELYIGGQEHFYLETNCTIAVPKGEAGEMELFVGTQNTMKTQSFVAKMLGVPDNRIVVRVKRMGGGFGGKETRSTVVSTAVALAAYKTGRPVRCMLDRDEDMLITGGRHPFLAKYKVGFMKTGNIVALEVAHFSNGGNTEDLSRSIMERALFHMDNTYKIPNIRGTGRICKTNLPSNTAFRGFGGPQGMLIAEHWMSEVAVTCGLPAEEVRRKNMYKEGDLTHFNQKLEGFTLPRCWDECIASSQYHARKMEVEKFNRENCWKKRGLCIIPTKFGISFTLPFLNQGGALVHVYTDGSVLLTHGGTEMGQGLHTKMVQVASRALKIPTSKIHITETSTNTVPNTSPTAASASADINGQAIYEACQTILKRLEPFKKKKPKGSWEDWVMDAYTSAVSLSATGFYKTPNLGYSFETNSGNPFHYFSYGVACSEVEIDCLTGDHKNLRTDIIMDVGSSLNPAIDIGQVEGAFVQGLGLFTMEELHYSPDGSLHTRGPSTYKIPAFGSIPIEFRVSLLRDCPNKRAIYASKAVGEPPLFLASSIFFAIKDAIRAARAQRDNNAKQLFQLDSPATPEKIRNACVDQFTTLCITGTSENCKSWSVRV